MPKYPILSAKEIIYSLKKSGFSIVGQKGSHIKMKKREGNLTFITIIPNHKIVAAGTLKSILSLARIELAEFMKNLK